MATIVFFPEGAYGPTNNCVGIGDLLRLRGHRVAFVVEESFAGTLEAKGFEERLIRPQPPTGLGVRLDAYAFEDAELPRAIDALLADAARRKRAAALAQRLQAAPGTVRAADPIERVALTGEPVTRA